MADGMMDLLADIRRRGIVEGLRLAEEIARMHIEGPSVAAVNDVASLNGKSWNRRIYNVPSV